MQLSHEGDGQHVAKIEKAMRLSEDVIRYMTVKQEGPLPTPRPSNKESAKIEKKDNDKPIDKVESKKVDSNETSTTALDKQTQDIKDNLETAIATES